MSDLKYLVLILLLAACKHKTDAELIRGNWQFSNGDFKGLEVQIDSTRFIYKNENRFDTFRYKLNDKQLMLIDPNGKPIQYELKFLDETDLLFGHPDGYTAKLKRK